MGGFAILKKIEIFTAVFKIISFKKAAYKSFV